MNVLNNENKNIIKINNFNEERQNSIYNASDDNDEKNTDLNEPIKINEIQNESLIKYKNEDIINIGNKKEYKIKKYKDGKYEGEFVNDKREGKGIFYYIKGNKYEGEWKNDKRHGKGKMYYTSGDIYDGDYKNDKKEGKGITYFNTGNRYEGDFKNGKREGKGIYYYKSGNREMGDFLKDKPIGKHVTLTVNGEIKVTIYK